MKFEYEIVTINEKSFQGRVNRVFELANKRGFRSENTLCCTFQAKPGTALTGAQLMHKLHKLFSKGKFEIIGMYQTLSNSNCIVSINDDFRSTTHVHFLLKGRYSEIKMYIDEWNKHAAIKGNKLAHAFPIPNEDTLYDFIKYFVDELRKKPGFRYEPALAFLKKRKRHQSTDWFWNASKILSSILAKYRRHMFEKLLKLSRKRILYPVLRVVILSVFVLCISGMSNGPPIL